VIEVRKTDLFAHWLDDLRDPEVERESKSDRTAGSRRPGGCQPVGEGVSELRVDYGPGYRVYFKKHGRELIILLAGGEKNTQAKDIKAALRLARNLQE